MNKLKHKCIAFFEFQICVNLCAFTHYRSCSHSPPSWVIHNSSELFSNNRYRSVTFLSKCFITKDIINTALWVTDWYVFNSTYRGPQNLNKTSIFRAHKWLFFLKHVKMYHIWQVFIKSYFHRTNHKSVTTVKNVTIHCKKWFFKAVNKTDY